MDQQARPLELTGFKDRLVSPSVMCAGFTSRRVAAPYGSRFVPNNPQPNPRIRVEKWGELRETGSQRDHNYEESTYDLSP